MALNVASVRVAIGRVKPASMNAAHGAIRGRKSWSIETRQPEEIDDVPRKVAEHLACEAGRGLGRRPSGEDMRQVGQHRAP